MADDQNKNKTTGTPNASTPASGTSEAGTTKTGGTKTGAASSAASAATSPAAGAPAPNVGTSGPSGTGATSGTSTTAAGGTTQPRPVTTSPTSGSPTADRLSLDPERPTSGLDRAKAWVEENPALAVLGAVALGLVIGRAVVAAIPEPEPKTLTGKIEKRAKELAEHGRYYAGDAGDAVSKQLAVASEALGEAAKVVAKNAKMGYKEAKDFSETLAESLGHAFSKKAGEWIEKMEKRA